MSFQAYAQASDYQAFTDQAPPANFDRLAMRASELIDNTVTEWYQIDENTGLPLYAATAECLRDACCAQVEFWVEVGEKNDVDGLAGTSMKVSNYQGIRPPTLAPRAVRILQNHELINGRGWIL